MCVKTLRNRQIDTIEFFCIKVTYSLRTKLESQNRHEILMLIMGGDIDLYLYVFFYHFI